MSLTVCVKSCHRDRLAGCHEAIRQTWGPEFNTKFFVGLGDSSAVLQPDEVRLFVRDDYDALIYKTQEICNWAVESDRSHILLVDCDTCVFPQRVRTCGYQNYDYMGRFNGEPKEIWTRELYKSNGETFSAKVWSWASGGGYFLSQRAAVAVSQSVVPMPSISYAEDVNVGQIISRDPSFKVMQWPVRVTRYYLSGGHSKGYDPASGWMKKTFEEGQ